MRKLYTVLAWTIAGAVVVQASAIAFAFGGMLNLVSEGGVVDKALLESFQAAGVGELGFMIHGIVGGGVIPLLAVALLVVSFFVRARGAKLWAAITLGLVVLQVTLGFSITDVPYLGLIHGANALAVVVAAAVAALRVGRDRRRDRSPPRRRRPMPSRRDLLRCAVVGVAVTTALGAGALAWSSTLLGEYSVMDMGGGHSGAGDHGHGGHAEHGAGGPGASAASGTAGAAGAVSVTALTADPDRPADVRVELVARQGTIDVPGGRAVEGYTVNGTSPGPEIRATQGDLVEVEFVNESVAAGATLHWHGIDVPNAADGVAGITQDAVPVGGRHVYRFEATDAGTYWYHSHQVSHEQVLRGLLGAIVIDPAEPPAITADVDVTALLHVYGGQHTLNGRAEDEHVGRRARLDRAGAGHQLRPGHRGRLVGGAVPGRSRPTGTR